MLRTTMILVSLLWSASAFAGELSVSLTDWEKAKAELARLQARSQKSQAPIAIGETHYEGRSDGRNLRVTMRLVAQLGAGEGFKRVPVIGADAVIVSATQGGRAIPLAPEGGYFIWYTKAKGQVELEVDFVVAPKGPRGSIEYRFKVVQSPVTELRSFFPSKDLSPRVSSAVTIRTEQVRGGTLLQAVLRPTSEVHVVGFHDVSEGGTSRQAKVYGETLNLVSLSDDSVELFSVVNLRILYAQRKRFRIALPAGYEIVSADGQGAFQYTVETIDHGPVLVGETAFGIRDRYEISLRLKRALSPTDQRVRLPVPKLLDVERDAGFVALEIPGKLAVDKVEGSGLVAIDVRELPEAIVRSSVSPVVRAFRYSGANDSVWLNLARYPETSLASGGVDHLRAVSVVTADGRVMSDVTYTIRNNLQQYLSVGFDWGDKVKSAVLDGEPIKPSRDAKGRVLVPLVRSKRRGGVLVPFKVQLVYESSMEKMGLFGHRGLALPQLEVPVSSVSWRIYVPGGYRSTGLIGGIRPQTFVKDATWHRSSRGYSGEEDPLELAALYGMNNNRSAEHQAASGERASGAMPVRVRLPRAGRALRHQRYWVDAGQRTTLWFYYARTPVVLLSRVLAGALLAGLLLITATLRKRALVAASSALVLLIWWGFSGAVVGYAAVAAALIYVARRLEIARVKGAAENLFSLNFGAIKERLVAFKSAERSLDRKLLSVLWFSTKSLMLLVLGVWVFGRVLALLDLLSNPL